ncbi:MAG: membrane protein insertion efficiency factor YidD [Ruminococcus flavefaciens]|nr:membrane protein insertion efficiency factor YidD [Ruminococcus flavefaciens]MCM1060909.1 membrane protein insertion efficiency factor YidD [Eubacterium sp.]
MIILISLYQKYAPESIRSACLFEPCCSEYMKLSIMKYGVIKGLFKGIKRILRYRYPNGGIDES